MTDEITTIRLQKIPTKEAFDSCLTPKMSDDKKLLALSYLWLNREDIIDLTKKVAAVIMPMYSCEVMEERKNMLMQAVDYLVEIQNVIKEPKAPKSKLPFMELLDKDGNLSFANIMKARDRRIEKERKESGKNE